MRRARALQAGENNTGETVRGGKAKLLLIAADASDNAIRRAENLCAGRSVLPVTLPFSKEEFGACLGMAQCSMAAVTELGFANALMKQLAEQWPDEYGAKAEEVARRFSRAERRRAETARERNKRNGKRRTDV